MRLKIIKSITFLLLSTTLFLNLNSEESKYFLNLKDIYSSDYFKAEKDIKKKWIKKSHSYTFLRKTGKHWELISASAGSKKSYRITDEKELIKISGLKKFTIDDYSYDKGKNLLLLFTNSKRVWRTNSRGDYYLFDINNRKLHKLGNGLPDSSLMFAKLSPSKKYIAYVSSRNIYLEKLESGKPEKITKSDSKFILNGRTDWAYEEEFHLRDAFRWSPNGDKIAFLQFNIEHVRNFYMINNTDGLYSKILPVQYPKAGGTNSACRIGIANIKTRKIKWIEPSNDLRNNYIPQISWNPGNNRLYFIKMNRLQNELEICFISNRSGSVKTVFREKNRTWIELYGNLNWARSGKYFLWISERDGWRHIYRISSNGRRITDVTGGDFDIISFEGVDEKKGKIYFTASPKDAVRKYLFTNNLSGRGTPRRLTPGKFIGYNDYNLSPDTKYAFHTYSAFTVPPGIFLIKLPSHRKNSVIVSNKKLGDRVSLLKKGHISFFNIKLKNGVPLDAWMMEPPNRVNNKRYPAILYVYGEPWSQTVLDKWRGSGFLWHLFLTQKGYTVISIDNRGTPAPKGSSFRKAIYGKIGILNISDQAYAMKKILNSYDFIDKNRVGVWGWSGGGCSTLHLLFKYPDIFSTGVSVAPVTDLRLYDTIYEERYMGLPDKNPSGYRNGSAVNFAKGLKGNLLLIHGTGDDNVHYQNSEVLINKLIENNKQFSFMPYPNRTHSIKSGKNTRLHLFSSIFRFFKEKLKKN